MRYIKIVFYAALVTMAACRQREGLESTAPMSGPVEKTFLAYTPDSKAIMQTDHSLLWQESDQIWVEGCTGPFRIKDFTGEGTSASFSGSLEGELDSYRAVFPYTETARINSRETLDCALPSLQTVSGSRVVTWPLAVACSNGESLTFHHLTTAVLFTLDHSMTGVSQVVLRGNEGTEKLAGTYTIGFDSEGLVVNRALSSSKPAIAIQGSFEAGGTYCFNVSGEADFPSGMTIEVDFENGQYGTLTSSVPVTFKPGAYINLSNNLEVEKKTPSGKISSLADWREMIVLAKAEADLSRYCTDGELYLDCDLTIAEEDRLPDLRVPFNGNNHTITLPGNTHALFSRIYANVHDLNLEGKISYSSSSAAASLATQASADVTVSNVSSSVDIFVRTADPASSAGIKAGGLFATVSGDETSLTLNNCTYSGTIHTWQYVHSVGGIIAHGGVGVEPTVTIDGCNFSGTIDYNQFLDHSSSTICGRIGGIIGDASRVVNVKDCVSDGTINVHLGGFYLGNGGIGGVVARTTAPAKNAEGVQCTMQVTLSGNVENRSVINIYDIKDADKGKCGQVIGSVVNNSEPSGTGTENGSVNYYTTSSSAPVPTSGHFNLCQISGRYIKSAGEGNMHYMSYLLKTSGEKVIVIDGGWAQDAPALRQAIKAAGGHVDAWFITHPHRDHFEALVTILHDLQGITIDKIYYSYSAYADSIANSIDDSLPAGTSPNRIRDLYDALNASGVAEDVQMQTPETRLDIDGVGIKVLAVADDDLSHDLNNSCMVLRIWDDTKSVVFLGDAGILEGWKLLSECRSDLDCDYLQIAHHGNKGCDKTFYDNVSFTYALVPSGKWIWEADAVYTSEQLALLPNLDGGLTRSWIEGNIGASNCIVSYKNIDWWMEWTPSNPGASLPGFSETGNPYFE